MKLVIHTYQPKQIKVDNPAVTISKMASALREAGFDVRTANVRGHYLHTLDHPDLGTVVIEEDNRDPIG